MQQLSMNELTTYRWSLEEDVENYQQAGYPAIGVWLQKVFDCGQDNAVDLLAASDLHVSNIVWAGGFTGSDGRPVKDNVNDTIHALRLSAAMRAGCLVLYTGGRNNHTIRHAGRLLRRALDQLIPVAEDVEVPLAIEPMHPACAVDWTFITDLEDSLALIQEYDSTYLKLALDTYHFPLKDDHSDLFARLVPHLGIIHLGDRLAPPSLDQDRCLLGDGNVPLEHTINMALEAGYTGDFDVKLIGQEIEVTCYQKILERSRDLVAEISSPHQLSHSALS